jgi:ubiquinone/menaquinone biosynthesis C-methylase UbiE
MLDAMSLADRLFDAFMYPLEVGALRSRRRRRIPQARGRVLEIGAGTGANLPYYRWERLSELHLLDVELTEAARRAGSRGGVVLHEADVQDLPFADASFDTVVFTLVFCSVADPVRGLAEARRVLKPRGRLIFIEHVRPPGRRLARAADAANPVWHTLLGPCNINRDTVSVIAAAGFSLADVHRQGAGFLVDGVAARAATYPI